MECMARRFVKTGSSQGFDLEGQENFVSRLIMRIIRLTLWVIGFMNLLTKPPLTLLAGMFRECGRLNFRHGMRKVLRSSHTGLQFRA